MRPQPAHCVLQHPLAAARLNVCAALEVAKTMGPGNTVTTMMCDSGFVSALLPHVQTHRRRHLTLADPRCDCAAALLVQAVQQNLAR